MAFCSLLLSQLVGETLPVLGQGLDAGLPDRGDGRLGLLQAAALDAKLLLLLDLELEGLIVGQLRADLLLHQRLADLDTLLGDRQQRIKLVNRRRNRLMFGLLLRFLTCQRRELGPVLADLIGEELPLRRNQHGIGILWYDEISGYPFAARQCGAEARDVEPFGHEIVVQTIALCRRSPSDRARSAGRPI
ncbi:hypothetical protein ACVWZK_006077 [Bradyrhizobium sp. GM0.4]